MFKVEKDIKVPRYMNQSKYPFEQMQVGDSFFVPLGDTVDKGRSDTERLKRALSSILGSVRASRRGKRFPLSSNIRFTARVIEAPLGVRCWRVDDKAIK